MTLLKDYMNSMNVKHFTLIKCLETLIMIIGELPELYILENCIKLIFQNVTLTG